MADNKAAVVAAQTNLTAATALTAEETACKATVAFSVDLDTLEASRQCSDYKRQASYEQAKAKCDSAKPTLTAANQAVATAETKATDATAEAENAVAAADGLLSACPVCLSYPALSVVTKAGVFRHHSLAQNFSIRQLLILAHIDFETHF